MAKGSCMCGAVGYEYSTSIWLTTLPLRSGAAYTSNVVVPRTNFKVTKGSPKDYDVKGDSGKINKHWFCGTCGSSLYTELEIMPDVTCVKSGSLDGGAANHPVAVEFYTKDRLGYAKAVEGADQKPEFG
ncbi:uncharacterized protein LTR77_000878 [Saxophila tyrrhenica]|uniref:CENP-V/GFA domain-containing protein n=1 Tax=Saxophila tyrrhenica TaxID=1690608 RepID=A0AAV9PP99_9PEZI|nr:hypothetical protein LTR77_000878 [Saxophila tyrrhenica]